MKIKIGNLIIDTQYIYMIGEVFKEDQSQYNSQRFLFEVYFINQKGPIVFGSPYGKLPDSDKQEEETRKIRDIVIQIWTNSMELIELNFTKYSYEA